MKIDFWLPHVKIAGGTKVTLSYAVILKSLGHQVRVFVPHRGWKERLLNTATWKGIVRINPVYVRDWKKAADMAGDIVIADSWQAASALIGSGAKASLFHFVQHDERLYHGTPSDVERVYTQKALNKIAVSSWLKERFELEFSQPVFLLMNTVDRTIFYPAVVEEQKARVRILLLVHTYNWKGTQEGIDIIERLKGTYPHITLVGFGVRTRQAPRALDEYYYNPSQDQLRHLYATADIFVCPSWDEGFGLPSLEAMACGAVVVTYDNGGSRDFAFHEKTALVAPRRNTNLLIKEVERVVVDLGLRARLRQGGLDFVSTLPTPYEQGQRLAEFLASRT